MKKFSRVILAGLLVGTMVTVQSASALTCTITNTGEGSNNTCTEYVGRSCTVTNDTTITINESNDQTGSTGDASGDGATSGDSSNTNTSGVSGTIDNTGACVAAAPVTPTPTPAPTPQPEQGQVEAAQVVAPVGGVKAGSGGTDHSGVLVALAAASVVALGLGLRLLQRRRMQE